jgi:hypothetical protein
MIVAATAAVIVDVLRKQILLFPYSITHLFVLQITIGIAFSLSLTIT